MKTHPVGTPLLLIPARDDFWALRTVILSATGGVSCHLNGFVLVRAMNRVRLNAMSLRTNTRVMGIHLFFSR